MGLPLPAGPEPARLLEWYDRHRRTLPWRQPPGVRPDPYAVWLSEIMLQQTGVVTVAGYFERFLKRWPRVQALAEASLDEVLHAWQGLGYYARARNLHACAQAVVSQHRGAFPDTEADLRALPGIGRYTAAAIAAIAFDRPATVVDGNVERVIARLFRVETPLPQAKPELYRLAERLTPASRPGDYAQATMDLGATVCTPNKPACVLCPWRGACAAHAVGDPEAWPARAPKAVRPVRRGIVFWIRRADGAVLMQRRPVEGLLAGLMEFPSTPWRLDPWDLDEALALMPAQAERARRLAGEVVHIFTHFRLELGVVAAEARSAEPRTVWAQPRDFERYALPTLMKKVARHAIGQAS